MYTNNNSYVYVLVLTFIIIYFAKGRVTQKARSGRVLPNMLATVVAELPVLIWGRGPWPTTTVHGANVIITKSGS